MTTYDPNVTRVNPSIELRVNKMKAVNALFQFLFKLGVHKPEFEELDYGQAAIFHIGPYKI